MLCAQGPRHTVTITEKSGEEIGGCFSLTVFLIRGSNLQRGGGDFLIVPDYLLSFPDFSENYP